MPKDLLAAYEPKDLLADFEPIQGKKEAPSRGFVGNLMDYEKALGLGLTQGAGDVGASLANFPSSIYEKITGKEGYHVPHPSLQKYYPEGVLGSLGSTIGENIGSLAAPGGITYKALKLFNNPLARAVAGGVTGGLSGAASNEDARGTTGALGAALGAGSPLASSILRGLGTALPVTKGIAYAPYVKKAKYMQQHGLGKDFYISPEHLDEAERLMHSEGMNIPKEAIEHTLPLARAGEHDAIHAVQSTLKSLGRDLSRKGGVEGRLGEKMHGLAEKIMGDMNEQLELMGHGKAVELENLGKKRTARYYKQQPLKNMALKGVGGALGLGSGYEFIKHLLNH